MNDTEITYTSSANKDLYVLTITSKLSLTDSVMAYLLRELAKEFDKRIENGEVTNVVAQDANETVE